jgi:hypothetical protein
MLVDDGDDIQFSGNVEQGDDGTVRVGLYFDAVGFFLEPGQQVFCFAKVGKDNGARFSVNPPGFDDIPVFMSVRAFLLQRGHRRSISVYTKVSDYDYIPIL